ncbi:hypothetical protein CLOP_g15985 [Closterium sp. NIES-67]|nr:hypothetical protein CLOP_g15985 [Closterium sp. NIES-67]
MSPGDRDIAEAKCAELLAAGLIRELTSDYAAATVVAARKDLTGETLARRMCGDYRGLNRVTKSDRYPMPMAEEIFDKLAEGKVYSTLDLRQGFNQIPIKEEEKQKTAFHGPDRLYEWNYMPFGLKNASAKFQRVMNLVLRGIPQAIYYIDDVVVFSKDGKQHVADVAATLAAIQAAGLTCHPRSAISGGMGAVLCQEEGGLERVVAYASRSCSPAEGNYSSYEGEGLAAVWAVELFRPYLQGRRFTLVTDHQPLLWLMTNQTLKGRNARWAMRLQEFEFDVKHRPGKTLQQVDGLSRQGPGEPP